MQPTTDLLRALAIDLGAPIEAWAFRAGCKPVAFLTVEAAQEARVRGAFEGVFVERRERQVTIGAGDRWDDDRTRGAPRIELYVAREAAPAQRAATLQTADPSRHAAELGALFGYPPCCVAAFAAQRERGDNTRNRYEIAKRTMAASTSDAPTNLDDVWPWQLNELHLRLVAFYPCTYRCEAAREIAARTLAAIEVARPGTSARLRAALARPVLYVDHDRQVWLDGTSTSDGARYRAVDAIGRGHDLPEMAATIARGETLAMGAAIEVARGGETIARIERRDPTPGFLARFA